MPIPNHEYGQMGNFKVYTSFKKSLVQTAPSAWKRLKTQFWGPLSNWKFELSPKAHTHSDLIFNKHTEQVKKNYVWIYHGMHWATCYRSKLSVTLKSKDFTTCGFQKISDTPIKTRWSRPQFQKSLPTPCKTTLCFSPLTSGLESFGHKSTPSDRHWIKACCPTF